MEKISPFEPRKPVSPEKLEGRQSIIEDYAYYLSLASAGQPQHFYLKGNRGVGKSSLASYMLKYAKLKYNMIGIHIYNDGIHDMDDLISNIIETLLNEVKNEKISDKLINLFKDHVESIGFLKSSIKLKANSHELLRDVKVYFAKFLVNIIDNLEGKGLFIVIDDINGLSKTPDFANWYKSFADTLATTFKTPIPLAIMLTSHSKVSRLLYKHNPSFNRIFVHRPISFLEKNEVEDFFIKEFKSQNISIEDDALNLMVEFTAGSPTMMQNIGDKVYLNNIDNLISKQTALKGIEQANNEIKLMYIQDTLEELNPSENDLKILKILGNDFINNAYRNYSFKINDLFDDLSKFDKELIDNFIQKALNTGIIEYKSDGEEFIFSNDLYPIYFAITKNI